MCIPKLDIHLVYLLSQQAQGSKVLYLCSLIFCFFIYLFFFITTYIFGAEGRYIYFKAAFCWSF